MHQFVPDLGYRDAVGNHTLETQRALTTHDFRSDIWVESAHPELARRARPYTDYAKLPSAQGGNNTLLYQASTGSNGLVDFLLERPEPMLVYYHNITPAHFYEPFDPGAAVGLETGRLELARVCKHVRGAMANSDYSARELRELGVEEVTVIPPYMRLRRDASPSRSHASWLRRSKRGIDVLFVGRIVPNKGHTHLLRAFAALRAGTDRQARLFVVGMWGPQLYMGELMRVRERLGSEGIAFTGSITDGSLAAHYRESDVLLCLSEHEGFCVPLVEAMRNGLPVIAYDAGGVAETLGGAGVLIRTLDPLTVSEVVVRVATDATLREAIVQRQFERLAELEAFPRDEMVVESVKATLGSLTS